MENIKLPGSGTIKFTSILLLISAGINIVVSIPLLLTSDYWDRTLPIFIPWSIWYIFIIVTSIYAVYLAITGFRYRNIAEKAKTLLPLCCVYIFITVLVAVFTLLTQGFNPFSFLVMVVPLSFLSGVRKNMKYNNESAV